ncbi:uncharacterized protein AMSG_11913 [Thecamonas trahens ATCC 50062]|uniref:Sugar phosphate transporter domain-containing protein n=1 Tax=Thecamonas trahens ATCC 50062 TaxID=461836 RepID=A0A0L0DCP5_THETB|nr:hypothetical protein AMSG_11913 [Thecamonas trahens ATCC 50062]KNC50089.1 hypothetical protein AMSG_11913 [Thecamonas trahens ATCC 50062]|eukprot:XP_013757306.1 hypothetical protein AMSG_11913 [Thecamonas trahens ATCC 50062]
MAHKRRDGQVQEERVSGEAVAVGAAVGVAATVWARGGLLVALLMLQSVSGAVLGAFEALVKAHVIVVVSLTMAVGAGGNASNQAAVAMIRALATGSVTPATAVRAMAREAAIGLGLAAVMAAAAGARTAYAVTIGGAAPDDEALVTASIAAIAIAVGAIVFISVVLGASLPLALHAIGLDPAHAGPVAQVSMDIIGVAVVCVVCGALLPTPAAGAATMAGSGWHSARPAAPTTGGGRGLVNSATMRLVATFVFWFASSIVSSNVKKAVLNGISLPLALTTFQFGACATCTLLYIRVFRIPSQPHGRGYGKAAAVAPDALPLHHDERPHMQHALTLNEMLTKVVPLSLTQVAAHFFTAFSMSLVPVSYMHTVKAMGPIFTIIVSTVFLSKSYPRKVWIALMFIFLGVSLASATELVFDMLGLIAAASSALIGVIQSLYSKHMLSSMSISHEHLLFYSSAVSFVILLPVALVYDGVRVLDARLSEVGWLLVLLAGSHFGQSIGAFQFLAYVTPLAYAIANTCKRLAIIVSSVVYFAHPVSALNALGMLIAFGGQAAYVVIKSSGR